MRKCIGCNEHFTKNELIRVLRTPTGDIVIDKSGRANGRGAYLCNNPKCLLKAIKAKRLDSALEVHIPEEVLQRLQEEIVK
jgi:predicted RNA-binding protein YlxR (DUF448 family)